MNDKPWIAVNVKSGYKRDKFSKYIFLQQIKPWKMVDPVTNPLGPAVDLLLVYIVCFWNRMHDFFGRHEGVNLQVSVWKLWPAQAHLCHKNNCMNPPKHQKPTISSWSPYYIWLMLKKELTNVWEKMYLLMNIAIISNTMDLSKTHLPSVSTQHLDSLHH